MTTRLDFFRALLVEEYQILDMGGSHKAYFHQFWGERFKTNCRAFIAELVKPLGSKISEFGKILESECKYFRERLASASLEAVTFLKADLYFGMKETIIKEEERQIKELTSITPFPSDEMVKIQNQAKDAFRCLELIRSSSLEPKS